MTGQINLVTSCVSVGSDLPPKRTSVTLKLTEENQTCLKDPPKVALVIWMSFHMLLAPSHRKVHSVLQKEENLGAYFTVCFQAHVQ